MDKYILLSIKKNSLYAADVIEHIVTSDNPESLQVSAKAPKYKKDENFTVIIDIERKKIWYAYD